MNSIKLFIFVFLFTTTIVIGFYGTYVVTDILSDYIDEQYGIILVKIDSVMDPIKNIKIVCIYSWHYLSLINISPA